MQRIRKNETKHCDGFRLLPPEPRGNRSPHPQPKLKFAKEGPQSNRNNPFTKQRPRSKIHKKP